MASGVLVSYRKNPEGFRPYQRQTAVRGFSVTTDFLHVVSNAAWKNLPLIQLKNSFMHSVCILLIGKTIRPVCAVRGVQTKSFDVFHISCIPWPHVAFEV